MQQQTRYRQAWRAFSTPCCPGIEHAIQRGVLSGARVAHTKHTQDRWLLLEREVGAPRGEEARWMGALPAGKAPLVYMYSEVGLCA